MLLNNTVKVLDNVEAKRIEVLVAD